VFQIKNKNIYNTEMVVTVFGGISENYFCTNSFFCCT